MDVKAVALEAITEGMHILDLLATIDHNNAWPTTSTPRVRLDKLAQALDFPNALAVQEQVEGDRQHATAKRRDAGW